MPPLRFVPGAEMAIFDGEEGEGGEFGQVGEYVAGEVGLGARIDHTQLAECR